MNSFKVKALAAAMGLAMTAIGGNAMAAIAGGSTGNGELFLTVWDAANSKSYTRDLGILMDNFGTQNAPAGGFASVVDPNAGNSLNIASDANWASFLSTGTASNVANLQWAVTAFDSVGTSSPNQLRVLFTSNQTGVIPTNSKISNLAVNSNQFVNDLNQTDTTFATNNSYIVTDATRPGYGGFLDGLFSNTSSLVPWGAPGQTQSFHYMTRGSGTLNGGPGIVTDYANAQGLAAWKLNTDGSLNFTATAPVPEPGEWAMLLAGLAVVGSIARRRLSSHV